MISLALSAGFAVEDTCAMNACHAAVYSRVTVHAGKVSHMAQMTTLCHRRCTIIYSYSCAMALLSTTLYLSDPDTRELWWLRIQWINHMQSHDDECISFC